MKKITRNPDLSRNAITARNAVKLNEIMGEKGPYRDVCDSKSLKEFSSRLFAALIIVGKPVGEATCQHIAALCLGFRTWNKALEVMSAQDGLVKRRPLSAWDGSRNAIAGSARPPAMADQNS